MVNLLILQNISMQSKNLDSVMIIFLNILNHFKEHQDMLIYMPFGIISFIRILPLLRIVRYP